MKTICITLFIALTIICSALVFSQEANVLESLPVNDYLLGPGDELTICTYWGTAISNENNQVDEVEVRANGYIFLPLLGEIPAENLTLAHLEQSVLERLQRIIKQPKVFIKIKKYASRKVTVFGEAHNGIYPLTSPLRIAEFLSSIGGVNNNADISNIRISRKTGEMIQIDLAKFIQHQDVSQNIQLKADDLILIPAIAENKVMVLGEVKAPGVLPVQGNLSLIEALVKTGGATEKANLKNVHIIRFEQAEKQIQRINIFEIIQKDKKVIFLKPGDFVYVPNKNDMLEGMNKILRTILPSLQTVLLINSLL